MAIRERHPEGLEHFRPFFAFYRLGGAGKRFKNNRNITKLVFDGPQYLIEQVLRTLAEKGHHAFKESAYYQPVMGSTPCRTTVWVWNQILSKSCDVLIDFPKNSDGAIAWVKRTNEKHPNSRACEWTRRQIERYEQCDDLEFIQGAVRKTESVFKVLAWVDPSEFTSSIVLILQDVQDASTEFRPFIMLRKRMYRAIDAAPEKLIATTHGSPERKTNHFGRFSSPIVFKTAAAVKPKEEALQELKVLSAQVHIVCESVEKSTFHVLFPEAVHTVLPKVGRFFGRQTIRWYICDATGYVIASGYQYAQRCAGYEEDELASQETIVTVHWYAKWMLWTLMLNLEAKNWKAERERAPQDMREVANGYGNRMRELVAQKLGTKVDILGGIASYVLPYVQGNVEQLPIQRHQPPPPTIWRQGWNAISRCWRDCFNRHPHQE